MQLIENGPAELVDGKSLDLSALDQLNQKWRTQLRLSELPFSVIHSKSGMIGLQAKNVAGFVRIGDLNIQILPKFVAGRIDHPGWRTSLWNFLAYGEGLHLTETASGAYTEDDGLTDLLAELFLEAVSGGSVLGFPIGYKESSIQSQFLKGRLDPKSYSRLIPPTGKLTSLATRLTTDIEATQLLKWASTQLMQLVSSPTRRQALHRWQMLLTDVSSSPPRFDVHTDDHRYPHLADAFAISRLLMLGQSVRFGEGVAALPGFLWNSDRLFESVCFRMFSEAIRPLKLRLSKPRLLLASGDGLRLNTIPDMMVQDGNRFLLSIDAKYKHLGGSSPKTADIYQAMAVGRVANLPIVGLVYPKIGKGISTRQITPEVDTSPNCISVLEIGLEAFENATSVQTLTGEISIWVEGLIRESVVADQMST